MSSISGSLNMSLHGRRSTINGINPIHSEPLVTQVACQAKQQADVELTEDVR